MAADLSYVFSLPANPKSVFEMLTNPEFLNKKIALAQSGTFKLSGDHPNLQIEVTRKVNADLPAMVRKFVGENLVVQETQIWHQPSSNTYQATFSLKIPNAPVDISGQINVNGSTQTQVSISAKVKVNLPIFGAAAEPNVVETIKKVLADEAKLCARWIENN